MTEIFYQLDSQAIQPGQRCEFFATPRWWSTLEFVSALGYLWPNEVFMDSFRIDHEEFIWPWPEKQFPLGILGHRALLAESPKLREIFPTKKPIGPPNRVTIGFRSYASDPLPIAVQWQWSEHPK